VELPDGGSRPAIMQLSTSSTDLAIRLMHALHRYRSDQLGVAAVSRFFVQAIEEAVGGAKEQRKKIAVLVFRIDLCLLDALDDLGQRADLDASATGQIRYSSAVERFLHTLLPEVVRQIARIEVGQEVDVLSKDQHSFGCPVPLACSVERRAEVAAARNPHEPTEDLE
jgi:hypothetical protein